MLSPAVPTGSVCTHTHTLHTHTSHESTHPYSLRQPAVCESILILQNAYPIDPTTHLLVSTSSLKSTAQGQPSGGRSQLPATASGRDQQGTCLGGCQVTAEGVSRGGPLGGLDCSQRAAPSVVPALQGSGFQSLSWALG